ncbi:unnamed protein product [Ranitomeya imitator]|uniref:NmrA-like domain-containing protein n=1 Tax=Ranitomeya imitator TaxID=111125 RepID=A0ABN9LN71_9NEOB|nr:unnamed protein product [Ranitomeya imitator]
MIAITGAAGQLGRLVIENLLKTVKASEIVAVVRNLLKLKTLPNKAYKFVPLTTPIEVGQRAPQHKNVITAPPLRNAGVSLIAYTSLLHLLNKSPLGLAG